MTELNWAPLVYARTHETDFRFIITPEDFTSDDKNWVLNYIHATTRSVEKLSEKPRWSLFKDEYHCVFGVTCMVRELIGQGKFEISEEMTKDSQKRPLYIFLGYVAKVQQEKNLSPLPNYSDKNLAIFQELYIHVIQKWREKSYQTSQNNLVSRYSKKFATIDTETKNINSQQISPEELNYQDEKYLYLWCNYDNQNLWLAASQCQHPVSVCLGSESSKDILNSPFLNGTAFDVQDKIKISRVTEVEGTTSEVPLSPQITPSQDERTSPSASASEEESFSHSLSRRKWGKLTKKALQLILIPVGLGITAKGIFDLLIQENQVMEPMDESLPIDLDGDGISDAVAHPFDADNDGENDDWLIDIDNDHDGEIDAKAIATSVDYDGDGQENGYQIEIDTDLDGTPDESENFYFLDTDGDGVRDTYVPESEMDVD